MNADASTGEADTASTDDGDVGTTETDAVIVRAAGSDREAHVYAKRTQLRSSAGASPLPMSGSAAGPISVAKLPLFLGGGLGSSARNSA